jgi:hypothetical protein
VSNKIKVEIITVTKTMSADYILKSEEVEQTLSLSLDFLQGIYSAQLLAGMEQYSMSRNLLNIIGQLPVMSENPFTIKNSTLPLEPVKVREYERGGNLIRDYYLDVADMPKAYNSLLADVLVFNPVLLDVNNIRWDMTKTPYHIIANFSGWQAEVLMTDGFDILLAAEAPQEVSDGQINSVFESNSDMEPSRYYIGASPDARDTFMIKLTSNNIPQFLQGFFVYFKWVAETADKSRGNRIMNEYLSKSMFPDLYVYDYGREVVLQNVWSLEAMESQLPVNITKLAVTM